MVETMRWTKGRLDLLDQTLLPEKVVYRPLRTVREVTDAISRHARARGSRDRRHRRLRHGARRPQRRPARPRRLSPRAGQGRAAARRLAADRGQPLLGARADAPAHRRRGRPRRPARSPRCSRPRRVRILEEDIAINRAMGRHGAALIDDGDVVLTHCNAGALATAGYGTALGVIRAAWEAGKRIPCSPTRPARAARAPSSPRGSSRATGIPVTVIADTAAGHFLRKGAGAEGRRRRRPHRRQRRRRQQDRHLPGRGAGARQPRAVLRRRAGQHLRPGRSPAGTRSRSRSATPRRSRTPAAGG